MTYQILTKEAAVGCGCAFEERDKNTKRLCSCGKTPIASAGKNLICIEHLPDALIRCGTGPLLGMKPEKKGVRPYQYFSKEDFLNAAKKEQATRG